MTRQRCASCQGPIPRTARVDAVYCGAPCRAAAHRSRARALPAADNAGATPVRGRAGARTRVAEAGHGASAITHLIGSDAQATRNGYTHGAARSTHGGRSLSSPQRRHNVAPRIGPSVSTDGPARARLHKRTARGTLTRPRVPGARTPTGQLVAAIVPAHDHDGRLCATCVSARVALEPPRHRNAVDPQEVLATLARERGNVMRTARLHGISERHVRRIRSGYRAQGGADAYAIAAVIAADHGETGRAEVAFGISHRHAVRIRSGWRPGGQVAEPIAFDSRSRDHTGLHGGGLSDMRRMVADRVQRARRASLVAQTRLAEAARVADVAADVTSRASTLRARIAAALDPLDGSWTCSCGEVNPATRTGCQACHRAWT